MVKHLNGWKMPRKVCNPDYQIYAEQFSGPNITCIKDLCSPFKQILQATSEFMFALMTSAPTSQPDSILNTLIDIAGSLKNDQHVVSISNIIPRTNNIKINEKIFSE